MSTKLTKVLSLMLAVLTLMCIVSTNDTAYAATAWPSVSRTAYMEFVAAGNINVYQNKGLTTRGTCSPSSAYNAYIETGDVCYVYEMTAAYIRVSYPVSSGRKEGFIRPSSILGSTSFVERITAKCQANTLKTRGGAYYGYTESGDSVYCITKDSSFTQIIYSAKSGNRAFKLAWMTTSNYNAIRNNVPPTSNIVNVALAEKAVASQNIGGMKYKTWYNNRFNSSWDINTPWCAIFVSWCAGQCGLSSDRFVYGSYCPSIVTAYKSRGQWAYRGVAGTPQPGWIILFSNSGDDAYHIGIVQKVENGYVYTIEGNTNGSTNATRKVDTRHYSLSYADILGYGKPNY